MEVSFTPAFIRQLKSLPEKLQEEVIDKIKLFGNIDNHQILKVHKLNGKLSGRYSFSVNYATRIVFCELIDIFSWFLSLSKSKIPSS